MTAEEYGEIHMGKRLRIRQVRSGIGRLKGQKLTIRALGIHRMGAEVIHDDTPSIRGMIGKVSHLVEVEEIKGA